MKSLNVPNSYKMLGYLSSLWFGIALMGSLAHGNPSLFAKKQSLGSDGADRIPASMRPEVFRPKLLDTQQMDQGAVSWGRAPGEARDPSTQTWGRSGVMFQSGF